MVIEIDDFTLIHWRVLADATLSMNFKLISPEMTKWIDTKHEQTILTHAHKFEKSVLHMSYNQLYYENEFGDICLFLQNCTCAHTRWWNDIFTARTSSFNLSSKRPVYVVTEYNQDLIGGKKTSEHP